jgi:hypothetical protein
MKKGIFLIMEKVENSRHPEKTPKKEREKKKMQITSH